MIVHADDWLTVHSGDCRAVLATMPERSVHTVVTSPPYWGLRDYGHGDQLGLEPTPEAYVANMVDVFRAVRRVLRDDGTLWLNLGDTFMSSGGERQYGSSDGGTGRGPGTRRHKVPATLKPKDLVGIPWRVAFALQADGWYLRSDVIWSKLNPMPESVTDRPTKSHEYLFLLAKSERYYFDAEAVRDALPTSEPVATRLSAGRLGNRQTAVDGGDGSVERFAPGGGRNIRSVWSIATQPYPGAHFATFPPKLVEPCILAGTSERGVCAECGSPWRRVVEREGETTREKQRARGVSDYAGAQPKNAQGLDYAGGHGSNIRQATTTGWEPTCDHDAPTVPATVLDPFGGSGTTAMVAQHLSRRAVLIDLNPDYIRQQMERNGSMPLGLGAA